MYQLARPLIMAALCNRGALYFCPVVSFCLLSFLHWSHYVTNEWRCKYSNALLFDVLTVTDGMTLINTPSAGVEMSRLLTVRLLKVGRSCKHILFVCCSCSLHLLLHSLNQLLLDADLQNTSMIAVFVTFGWPTLARDCLCQDMSYQCCDTDPDPYPDLWSGSPPKFSHLFHWLIGNLPWKFHANPFGSFCAKLLTDKQWRKH